MFFHFTVKILKLRYIMFPKYFSTIISKSNDFSSCTFTSKQEIKLKFSFGFHTTILTKPKIANNAFDLLKCNSFLPAPFIKYKNSLRKKPVLALCSVISAPMKIYRVIFLLMMPRVTWSLSDNPPKSKAKTWKLYCFI